ncbi:glycosyltransferase family 2 protein [Geotalea toluenoxydans]|uniref:glycosyltransferase family 2 protein n=1 Tax=Geotalea toluenoxydans TaxID=421624 RepID=UPI000AAB59FC|nr:glycosyltransferase family 2 protein [Geotalea toluenoxydans]
MKSLDSTASIVIYDNPRNMVRNAAASFLGTDCAVQLTIVDNSPTPALRSVFEDLPVEYHFNDENVGYGRGHNWAIQRVQNSKYHLILNPDIVVSPFTIKTLTEFMDNNPDIGMVCPKVLNRDGSIQHLNKRYPTVFDLFARRFLPKRFHVVLEKRLAMYETRDIGYETVHDVEFMTGCFMFCRTSVLKSVGGFDERYFMYFEDCDLGQKFQNVGYRTVYYPHATVTHLWERASHKSIKMMWVLIVNMVRYFNKWGWRFF